MSIAALKKALQGGTTKLPVRRLHILHRPLVPLRRPFCSVAKAPPQSLGETVRCVVMRHSHAIGIGGFCLLTLQWCMEDVLLLRCISMSVASSMIVFNYFRNPPILTAVRFNMLFLVLNGYFISKIILERRDLELSDLEQSLWDGVFHEYLSKVQLRHLLAAGRTQSPHKGALFCETGQPRPPCLELVVAGELVVKNKNGATLAVVRPGEFIGEFGFIDWATCDGTASHVTVAYGEGVQVVQWRAEEMQTHLTNHPAVRHSLEALWMHKLKDKLRGMNERESYRAYVNVLRGVMADGKIGEMERQFVARFKVSCNITPEQHSCALQELHCSEDEFDRLLHVEQTVVLQGRRLRLHNFPLCNVPGSKALKTDVKISTHHPTCTHEPHATHNHHHPYRCW